MVKTESRQFEFPHFLEIKIEQFLKALGLSLLDDRKIAAAVQQMSDFYIENPDGSTPWNEKWAQVAQAAYYFPLNYLRAQAVIDEAVRVKFFTDINSFCEVGSGLGALTAHLSENVSKGYSIEVAATAIEIYKRLFPESHLNFLTKSLDKPVDLFAFSYVLTELPGIPRAAYESEAILVIEPSTQSDGRRLMELRQDLIARGYQMWAPCTHQLGCPLLLHSKRDWCHDRIHLKMPDWFLNIEKHLKFKNRTVTFSYLLARKTSPETSLNKGRIVGDMLKEKGKTRIMICRQDEREFLSWLKKDKFDIELHRGDLLDLDLPFDKKSSELRLRKK